MGIWSIDILCGDDALEVYRQMLQAGLGEFRSRVPAAQRKYKEVVKTEDGQHTLLTITHSPEECRELLHLTQELDKDKAFNVRALLEANVPRIIDVANEQLNLMDSSSKAHRPAGNSMSILALLMMGAGCRLPHGLKSAILHGIQQDQFAKHYAPRQQMMQEFGQVVGGYDARGGSVVEWPIADLSEALHCIKLNAATTPKEHWGDETLLYSPFVPSSRVNRFKAKPGLNAAYTAPGTGEEMMCMVKGPGFRVAIDSLLPNSFAVQQYQEAYPRTQIPPHVHVLARDSLVQSVLEAERVAIKDPSPFALPHLRIGAVVLVDGLKAETYKRFNGQQGTVLGDGDNGRILVDLSEKSLLVKRENLTLTFAAPASAPEQRVSGNAGADVARPCPFAAPASAPEQRVSDNAGADVARSSSQFKPKTPVKTAEGEANRNGQRNRAKEGRVSGELQAAKAVVNLEPVLNAAPAKDVVQEEVGVCMRSGTVIFVGDDYATLSCSARCGPTLLKLSTLLELCPSAARRMDKVLGSACPRPGCAGKIEGLKGFKNSCAIREGNFGKGSKGPGISGEEGAKKSGKSESQTSKSALARAAANKEEWHANVRARASARVAAAEDAVGDVGEEDGGGQDQAHEEVAGKVLLGKDGSERKTTRGGKKDAGFLKKVMDKKKSKDESKAATAAGSSAEGRALSSAAAAFMPGALSQAALGAIEADVQNGGVKSTAAPGILIIVPQKKEDAPGGEMSAEEDSAALDRDAPSWLDDSSLVPLVRNDPEDDNLFQANRGCEDEGGGRAVGGKKKKDKKVLSIQEFFSTPSVDLTPGLSEEEQERLMRIEQERKDEMLARELARLDTYEHADKEVVRKPCFYMRSSGNCPFGDKCDFSHDPEVLKYAGYKEKLCFRWSQGGSCVLGDACGFAHGEHELRGAARSGGQAGAWGNAAASARANVFRPSYDPPYASVDLDWESPQHGYSGYNNAVLGSQCLEGQTRVHQLTIQEEERIRREGEQQYQAHLMYQAQKQYEKNLQVMQVQAEAERKAREMAAERARREAEAEAEQARRHAEEAAQREEKRRLLAEKQEAERMFMRKFLGGDMFSSLAPEFAPS